MKDLKTAILILLILLNMAQTVKPFPRSKEVLNL
jgi:hypothetical protein